MAVSISPWVRAVLWASGGFMRDGGRSRCEGHAILARRRYGAVQIARWVFALRLAREPRPEDEREGRHVGPQPSADRRSPARGRSRRDRRAPPAPLPPRAGDGDAADALRRPTRRAARTPRR